jgi:hypothetical protein
MSLARKLCYLAFTLLFIFSILPFAGIHLTSPVQAASAWIPATVTIKDSGLNNEKYILDSTVIKDGNTYKMWYTHVVFDMSISQLFTDMKGLNLDNVVTALQNYQFDTFLNKLVDIDPTSLWAILNGTRTVIGYATSTDGKAWTVVNSNVLGTTGNFFNSVGFPSVYKIDNTHYQMWYTSIQSTLTSGTLPSIFTGMSGNDSSRRTAFDNLLNSTKTVIKYATSTDGYTLWTIAATPALEITTGGDWGIVRSVGAPSVIMESTTNYTMWYTRLNTDFGSAALTDILVKVRAGTTNMSALVGILDSSAFVIGRAVSTDGGATFTYSAGNNKVLPNNTTPSFWQSAIDPCVIKTGSTYEMWYMNGTTNLVQSTLRDVFNAIKGLNIPALWNSMKNDSFATFLTNLAGTNVSTLKTSLTGTSGVIGYAYSGDGITWTASSPIDMAGVAPLTPWSSVGAPSVLKTSNALTEIWFSRGIDDLTWQKLADRVLGGDPGLGYASLAITPTTTPTTTPSGGGGGGGGVLGPGVTSVVSKVMLSGLFIEDAVAWSVDKMCFVTIKTDTIGLTSGGVALREISIIPMDPQPTLPADFKGLGLFYELGPSGATFSPPITISFSYKGLTLPAGTNEKDIFHWMEGRPRKVESPRINGGYC